MIPGENPYGWGVYSLPMLRDFQVANPLARPAVNLSGLTGTLIGDTPWRRVLFSILMACLTLLLALVLARIQPEEPPQPKPAPVEVTVMIPEPVPPAPAPVFKPESKPLRQKPPEPVKPPSPIPEPNPVVQKMPEPKPEPPPVRQVQPEPRPVAKPQPKEAPLPKPAPIAPRRQEKVAEAPPVLPQRKSAVPVQSETPLPKATTLAAYEQAPRSTPAPSLAAQKPALSTDVVPVSDIGIKPAAQKAAERRQTRASLPSSAQKNIGSQSAVEVDAGDLAGMKPAVGVVAARQTVKASMPSSTAATFGSPNGVELDVRDAGLSSRRYDTSRPASGPVISDRRQSVTSGSGQEAVIGSPQVRGMVPDVGERGPAVQTTVPGRTKVALADGKADVELAGPAATAMNTGTSQSTVMPTGSETFGFLDFLASGELDQSLMVSLNRLRTCSDPGEETKLKAHLAGLLSQPAKCRTGGVLFDIRNPESAYSIHIDLYNYEQKEFKDRCDALKLAVQSCEARR